MRPVSPASAYRDKGNHIVFFQWLATFYKGIGEFFIDEYPCAFFQVVLPGDAKLLDDGVDSLVGIGRKFHPDFPLTGVPLHPGHKTDLDGYHDEAYLAQSLIRVKFLMYFT
jgi:hypothetical protein